MTYGQVVGLPYALKAVEDVVAECGRPVFTKLSVRRCVELAARYANDHRWCDG
jgi:hypothetical protein